MSKPPTRKELSDDAKQAALDQIEINLDTSQVQMGRVTTDKPASPYPQRGTLSSGQSAQVVGKVGGVTEGGVGVTEGGVEVRSTSPISKLGISKTPYPDMDKMSSLTPEETLAEAPESSLLDEPVETSDSSTPEAIEAAGGATAEGEDAEASALAAGARNKHARHLNGQIIRDIHRISESCTTDLKPVLSRYAKCVSQTFIKDGDERFPHTCRRHPVRRNHSSTEVWANLLFFHVGNAILQWYAMRRGEVNVDETAINTLHEIAVIGPAHYVVHGSTKMGFELVTKEEFRKRCTEEDVAAEKREARRALR